MKKGDKMFNRNLIKSTLFLFLLVLISFNVIAADYIPLINDLTCDKTGTIQFDLAIVASTDDILIGSDDIMITGKTNTTPIFSVNGTYYKDEKKEKHLANKKEYEFISNERLFLENSTYYIQFKYDGQEEVIEKEVVCPGFELSCEEIDLKLNSCFQKEGFVFAEFSGVQNRDNNSNMLNSNKTNILNNLEIMINFRKSKSGKYSYDKIVNTEDIEMIDSDLFLIKSDISNLRSEINDIAIHVDGCDEYRYGARVLRIKDCDNQVPEIQCRENTECNEDETCEEVSGYCVKLNCNSCEILVNRTCRPKCSDNNNCTVDSCFGGVCQYESIAGCCNNNYECNDNLFCTKDLCEANTCKYSFGCEIREDDCVKTSCEEEKGVCVYEYNAACKDVNTSLFLIENNSKDNNESESQSTLVKTKEDGLGKTTEKNMLLNFVIYFVFIQALVIIGLFLYMHKKFSEYVLDNKDIRNRRE